MPDIDVFVTSILSNPQLRGRHERVRRALTSARVPYAEHDVASDEAAKSLWKRKNGGKNELPFILVDGEPVGNIDDMDEAVEFGELRQFLRLDAPPPPPSATKPVDTPSPTVEATPTASTVTTGTPPPPPKPSLDDFADLDLTESELAELAREISNNDTFSSGLVSNPGQDHSYDFSHATRRFEGSTASLKIEKINFTRALPDRPLASDVVRDELEGIEQGDLDIDELEQLAKELEAEEMERRRLRDAQTNTGSRGVEPPPLPAKKEEDVVETSTLPKEVAESTAVEGMGGASLSAPLAEIEKLNISTTSPEPGDLGNKTLTLESPIKEESAPSPKFADTVPLDATDAPAPPSSSSTATTPKSLFSSVTEVFTPSSSSSVSTTAGQVPERKKSTPTEVEHLKKSLAGDGGGGTDSSLLESSEMEMPSFGVTDMDPDHRASPDEQEQEEPRSDSDEAAPTDTLGETRREEEERSKGETLEDRVAQAIKGGDL
ncbi:uncharacterized protein JCM6883_001511 [Sporobolomyces salmoneus]|uniref:uncharacterized protein n=1 Tax=Sporobolomyces salmoneus TaxID=183962 RepID=UPI00317F0519